MDRLDHRCRPVFLRGAHAIQIKFLQSTYRLLHRVRELLLTPAVGRMLLFVMLLQVIKKLSTSLGWRRMWERKVILKLFGIQRVKKSVDYQSLKIFLLTSPLLYPLLYINSCWFQSPALQTAFTKKNKKRKTSQLTLIGCSLNKRSRIKGGKNRTKLLLAKVSWLRVGGRMAEGQREKVRSALSRSCRNSCPKEKAEGLPCAGISSLHLSWALPFP